MYAEREFAINLHNVSKRFGSQQSLDGLTLQVRAGAVYGLLGPNGAGKTTTMRALLGLLSLDEGSVRVLGLDPREDADDIRRQTGVLLESDGLYSRLNAMQNLDFHARIWRLSAPLRDARARELLTCFDLWDRRFDRVGTWSKGMRQKLALCRAMLHRPQLLLLDEPFSGLDPIAAVEMRNRIVTLAKEHATTVLLATHDLAHVERACTEVAVIRQGRVIAHGTPDEIGRGTAPPEVEVEVCGRGLDAPLLEAMQRTGAILGFALCNETVRIRCSLGTRRALAPELARRGVEIEELRTVRGSLEDSFVALVSAARGEQ